MASATSNPSATGPLANRPQGPLTLRIEPPSTWFELRLEELWKYRELLFFLVWRDVKVRYKQTAIGIAWVIVQPLLTLVAATNVVVENQRVITKVYFPRLILPVSAALSGLVDFAIGFVVLLIFTFSHGIRPAWTLLLLPLFLLLTVFTVLGVGLWLSALNALYRDVKYLTPFIVQFWTLASPVYYSSSMVPERYRWLYGLNPMTGVIDGFRWALTGTGQAPTATLLASTLFVCCVLFGGLIFFNYMEGSIADHVLGAFLLPHRKTNMAR